MFILDGGDLGLVVLGGEVGANAKGAVGGGATSCSDPMGIAIEDGRSEAFFDGPFLESFFEIGESGEGLALDELRHRKKRGWPGG